LLVGLKDQGNIITVEVRTTNETMGNFLLSQKEEIAKQLEGKNVYTNIYVDVQNENSQKREQKEQKEQKKVNHEEKAKNDFDAFIEAVA
jgi:3-deoxy-D-arabino-heptulosonate 7-phosphate (DAHP) synthase